MGIANKARHLAANRYFRRFGVLGIFAILIASVALLSTKHAISNPSHTLAIRATDNAPVAITKDQPSFYTSEVADIKQGETSSILLTKDGNIYTSGHNEYGQLGNGKFGGDSADYRRIDVAGSPKFTKIDMTHRHAVALADNGDVYTWGYNISGQIGNDTRQNVNRPTKVFSGANDIAAGYRFSVAIRPDGSLWAWGMQCDPNIQGLEELEEKFEKNEKEGGMYYDGRGQSENVYCLEQGNLPIASITPRHIESPIHFTAVTGGYGSILMLDNKQTAWGYGCNAWGQLGRGHYRNDSGTRQIAKIAFPEGTKITQLDAGFRQGIALDDKGQVWSWGHDERGDPIKYKANRTDKPEMLTNAPKGVTKIQAGHDEAGIIADGKFYAFGDNQLSQISRQAGNDRKYILQEFTQTDDKMTGIDHISLGYERNLYWGSGNK